jgi:putative DNA methylase
MSSEYIKAEGKAGRIGSRMMAIVAEGRNGRLYLAPTPEHETLVQKAKPKWRPDATLPDDPRNFWTVQYGLTRYEDLFTLRQLVALTTFSDLVLEVSERVKQDAINAGMLNDNNPIDSGGNGASAYAEALSVYLACAVSKMTNIGSSIASWMSDRGAFREMFARQAIPMVWDFAEANTFADIGGSFLIAIDKGAMAINTLPPTIFATVAQLDATSQTMSFN